MIVYVVILIFILQQNASQCSWHFFVQNVWKFAVYCCHHFMLEVHSALEGLDTSLGSILQVQLLSDEELRFTSEFHDNCGKNVSCKNDNQTAERISSYNQGLVFSAKPLPQNHLFQVNLCPPISTFCIRIWIRFVFFTVIRRRSISSAFFRLRSTGWTANGPLPLSSGLWDFLRKSGRHHHPPSTSKNHRGFSTRIQFMTAEQRWAELNLSVENSILYF